MNKDHTSMSEWRARLGVDRATEHHIRHQTHTMGCLWVMLVPRARLMNLSGMRTLKAL